MRENPAKEELPMKSRAIAASVAVLALGIGVAACGDDDDSNNETTTTSPTTTTAAGGAATGSAAGAAAVTTPTGS